ncbi:MAG: hypothetical protein ACRD0Y_10705 [Terriglobales bacterium]
MRSDNPAHIEWVHAAAAHLQIGAVRALPTLRSARSWLATHPGCRVLMLDRPEGMWLLDLRAAYAPFLLAVANVPGLTGALRKIFHHVPEISVRGGKIAA